MYSHNLKYFFLILFCQFIIGCGSNSPEGTVGNIIESINRITSSIENNNADEFMSAMTEFKKRGESFKDSPELRWLQDNKDTVEAESLQMKLSFAMRDFDRAMMDVRHNRKFMEAFASDPKKLKWIRKTIPGLANFWNIN